MARPLLDLLFRGGGGIRLHLFRDAPPTRMTATYLREGGVGCLACAGCKPVIVQHKHKYYYYDYYDGTRPATIGTRLRSRLGQSSSGPATQHSIGAACDGTSDTCVIACVRGFARDVSTAPWQAGYTGHRQAGKRVGYDQTRIAVDGICGERLLQMLHGGTVRIAARATLDEPTLRQGRAEAQPAACPAARGSAVDSRALGARAHAHHAHAQREHRRTPPARGSFRVGPDTGRRNYFGRSGSNAVSDSLASQIGPLLHLQGTARSQNASKPPGTGVSPSSVSRNLRKTPTPVAVITNDAIPTPFLAREAGHTTAPAEILPGRARRRLTRTSCCCCWLCLELCRGWPTPELIIHVCNLHLLDW